MGDFDDADSIAAALDGVKSAYLVTPSSSNAEAQQVQGFLAFQATIANQGRFFAPIGDARVSAVDVRDIALVAAAVLTQPGHLGKTYTITGPAAVTHAEIAQAIAEAIGRDVTFVDVAPEDFAGALAGFGVPPWQVEGLVEDYAHSARGEASEVHHTVREIAGRDPRDVSAFARDYASAFTAS
jgi:uncharacterized protein YbjT (DUF2867 family)